MRILIAAIIGGIIMFIWGAVAHTALPLGEMGIAMGSPPASTLAALKQDAGSAGIYMLPSPTAEQMSDESAMNAFIEANKDSAYAFVIYQPGGNPGLQNMAPNLITQFVSDTLAALVVAFVLALGAFGFGKRVMIAGSLAAFSWLATNVPYWNWYRFPTDFTAAALAEQLIGWILAGAGMAWWLGRKGG